MKTIIFGGAILMLLTVAKAVFPLELHFLPLGGSAIAEMGVVLGISVAITTIAGLMRDRDDKN
ncbi:hypothetical protein [Roseibium sp. Sym1]|uniref:hypothetical protein n=1 Tax=Roseibium sp. Sym1 TaxID=3016006 RepID=UPI0022B2E11A|nr:hypothetical protein [Roseibium sp. Sym1]